MQITTATGTGPAVQRIRELGAEIAGIGYAKASAALSATLDLTLSMAEYNELEAEHQTLREITFVQGWATPHEPANYRRKAPPPVAQRLRFGKSKASAFATSSAPTSA